MIYTICLNMMLSHAKSKGVWLVSLVSKQLIMQLIQTNEYSMFRNKNAKVAKLPDLLLRYFKRTGWKQVIYDLSLSIEIEKKMVQVGGISNMLI